MLCLESIAFFRLSSFFSAKLRKLRSSAFSRVQA